MTRQTLSLNTGKKHGSCKNPVTCKEVSAEAQSCEAEPGRSCHPVIVEGPRDPGEAEASKRGQDPYSATQSSNNYTGECF